MIRPLELYIGLRYTRAKRRNHFISFISFTSMAGIALGVCALITVLSVMNGFERELRDRILAVASHVTISKSGGVLNDWPVLAQRLKNHGEIQAQAPYIMGQGMLTRGGAVTGSLLRGISPEHEQTVSELLTKIDDGNLDDLKAGEFGIVLGYDLARQLGIGVGDKVTVVAPKGKITPAGLLPRLKRFTVVAIFRLNMYEYDSGLALLHIDDASRLLQLDGDVNGLRLKLDDVYRAPIVRQQLYEQFGLDYSIRDWTQEHANFFNALVIEKRVMFIILFLIVLVAAFNIVSTLVMAVTDKQADIAILRTLGIRRFSIMKIFVIQGSILGILGTIIGGILGILLALNVETIIPYVENKLGLEFFPASIYVISDFPAEMRWPDVTRTIIGAFVVSVVSTIYPAWRASRVQPADALRYE